MLVCSMETAVMLIITGLGRCGTSFLARFCDNMGFKVGGRWMGKVNAGYEDLQVQRINHDMHMVIRKSKPMQKSVIMKKMGKINNQVAKDPGFMKIGGIHNEMIRTWWDVRKDIKFLILSRNIYQIESSYVHGWGPKILIKNNGHNRAETLFRANEGFYDIIEELNIPYNDELEFPDFLDKYKKVSQILHKFGDIKFDIKKGRTAWDKLRDDNLVHTFTSGGSMKGLK